ncbi:hypothetical protein GCK32_015340 [Trichostrongylus colubriformis]|uniref:Methyltransferase FkbM domain-containing protein n=1 Tax=Trichostrongylus colubriformis TaxID=6319 RepID=A0AAN8F1I3_TRICO
MYVEHIDLNTFFTSMVNRTRIDHLVLDNEGPEYDMIPMIAVNDTLDNIVICHMNVEFHCGKSSFENFAKLMLAILRRGRSLLHEEIPYAVLLKRPMI